MKYIFDFDHTLFNNDLFREASAAYVESGLWVTPAIWNILEARSFLYEDTVDFLTSLQKEDVRILTAMSPALGSDARNFQKVKLEKSGLAKYVSEIIFMEGDKGPYVQEMHDGTPTVFVDDKLAHLVSVKKMCPKVHVVQMVRPGLEDRIPVSMVKEIPVISSLSELSHLF